MKRYIFIVVSLALILILLIGCTSTKTSTSTSTSTTSSSTVTSTTSTTSKPASSTTTSKPASSTTTQAGPVKGGVLRIECYGEASSFDSYSATTALVQTNASMVFSGLIRTDPLKEDTTLENLRPCLAEKWEKSADGKTYTFYLRKDVKWHDGQGFDAADVVYSFNKYRDPKKSVFANYVSQITKVEQPDQYTVKVTLSAVFPDFLLCILPPNFSIYPEHLKDVDPKSTKYLVGTGPFMFKEFIPGKKISFVKNPNYFVSGLPYLDGVDIYYISQAAMPDAFIGGQLDVCGNLRSFFDTNIADVKKVKQLAPEAVIKHIGSGNIRGVLFSFAKKGPWNDIRVRQAMALVVDPTEAVIAMKGGLELNDVPTFGFIPHGLTGAFTKEQVNKILGTDQSMAERIKQAKILMALAGYGEGFNVVDTVRQEAFRTDTSLYLADMWKKYLNITTDIKVMESAQWTDIKNKGDWEITVDGLSVATKLRTIEYLEIFLPGGANYGSWLNENYNATIAQLQSEQDPAKQLELITKAQNLWYEGLPWINVVETSNGVAWRPDLMTGWPAVKGIVMQKTFTTQTAIDCMWLAGTPDAKRWMGK
jgi:peptide/nickel transport system substrate-binding protein